MIFPWILPLIPFGIILYYIFKDKKTLLIGPPAAGKTSFIRHISNESIPEGPTSAKKKYETQYSQFDVVKDFGGGEEWLQNFNMEIKEYNNILFFYDVSEFIKNNEYRQKVYDRLYFIRMYKSDQKVLLVGTHIDLAPDNYKYTTETIFAKKGYQDFLEKSVFVNTNKKNCVNIITSELNK